MELDDLKQTWQQLGESAPVTASFHGKTIDMIEQKKLRSKLLRITIPETIGSLVCAASAFFVLLRFNRLDAWHLQVAGYTAVAVLLILPVISIASVIELHRVNNMEQPYAASLKLFIQQKRKFYRLQQVNFFLCNLLLVAAVFLSVRLFGYNAITDNKYYYIIAFSAGYCFLLFFMQWTFKNYRNIIQQTETMMKDLSALQDS